MGNKGSQVLVSEEKIDHTIKIIMDGGEMQDSNILVEGLKTIHICLERDEIYRWSKEAEIFIINNAIVKIFYHPHYEKVLVQFLDRYIE